MPGAQLPSVGVSGWGSPRGVSGADLCTPSPAGVWSFPLLARTAYMSAGARLGGADMGVAHTAVPSVVSWGPEPLWPLCAPHGGGALIQGCL